MKKCSGLMAALVLALTAGQSGAAGLVGDSVNLRLVAPAGVTIDATPFSLLDTLTVVSGGDAEVAPGNGTDVGGYLLTNGNGVQEFIDFHALTIALRLVDGDPEGDGTGYGAGAYYEFGDLDIAGQVITGATLSGSGFANFSANWLSFDGAKSFKLALDTLRFSGGPGDADHVGELLISLTTRDVGDGGGGGGGGNVPEPGALALTLAGLGALRYRGHRMDRR